jgi:hypothetical protein
MDASAFASVHLKPTVVRQAGVQPEPPQPASPPAPPPAPLPQQHDGFQRYAAFQKVCREQKLAGSGPWNDELWKKPHAVLQALQRIRDSSWCKHTPQMALEHNRLYLDLQPSWCVWRWCLPRCTDRAPGSGSSPMNRGLSYHPRLLRLPRPALKCGGGWSRCPSSSHKSHLQGFDLAVFVLL